MSQRIDVHHHFAPPQWMAARARQLGEGGNNPWKDWSPRKSLDAMDSAGVTTAIASLTTPGAWIEDGNFDDRDAARALARECNEYGARMASDHRGRFGVVAALPMPDIDGSLREIEYALDVLKFDGVGLMTSFGDRWLGDGAHAPVFEELNRRKAVVLTHPTTPNCCAGLIPQVGPSTIEYGADTTRAIMSLLVNGTVDRYPGIRFVFSHAGGTMPFLISRIVGRQLVVGADGLVGLPSSGGSRSSGGERLAQLRTFYYDTAQQANPVAMAALRKVIPVSRIVFGTDYPYTSILEHVTGLQGSQVFSAGELRAIDSLNWVEACARSP
jgi:predicted TIM-barrel fold metal-dependent hydrolase